MLIGATMNTADLPTLSPELTGNMIMRVFPSEATVAGHPLRVLPAWTDTRFVYCREVAAIPFVSTKVDGDSAAIAYVREQLLTLPDWVSVLYITDRHEPEGDVTPQQFKSNFVLFMAMVESLPAGLRARIRCGPVLTKTWTEQPGTSRSYSTYDPGIGDFLGCDMYVQSGTANQVVSPATLPTPAAFVSMFKAYKFSPADRRPRIWPEWGVIGMPDDMDGTGRAAWIRGVYAEVKTWSPQTTGWEWLGMIWWNSPGKATGQVAQIGQRRDFPLSLRTQPATGRAGRSEPTAVRLPGSPPAPVAAYNELWAAEASAPQPGPGPAPEPVPAVRTYEQGWREGRQDLLAQLARIVGDR